MKVKLFFAAALALSLGFASSASAEEKKTIADIVVASKDHTILLAAVKEAGLVETLSGKGPFTVFAPTDEAFKKIPKEKLEAVLKDKELLKKILLAHVIVEKAVMAKDALAFDGKEVNGFMIMANKDGVKIGDAKVIKADIKASNGVIHVIDTVLIPTK